MPKIIDHNRRKQEILKRAFVIFSQKGYQDTNLSYIAHCCSISRPTLYLYFKEKEEIFYFAVNQMTEGMYRDYKGLLQESSQTEMSKLKFICQDIIEKSYRKREFFPRWRIFCFR